ncbi:LysR family transcriptional regulator [Pandoraea commovens]|uniref:HTH-type transcriptional regulator DmlR n=1 Tax=Pandoraea commovens TaxID=2508289 RepID=A0A5E4X090_9BURK|nr:LysR family transcriptional regulator [Pandoraea commovens]VVE29705.1 HTH-type transcriptional regulator DmlR [Pandoraea commovens]
MDLNGTLAFVTVVECGSFSAAARTLEIPRSTLSARVASLEAHLGVILLRRTTRRIALTDDGRDYFERAARAIRTLREAEQFGEADASGRRPLSGSIRLGVPFDFPFDALSQAIATFREAHPRVRFDVLVDDSVSDFVDDNLDMAIRGGQPGGDHIVARRIATFGFARFASPVFERAMRKRGSSRGRSDSHDIPRLVFKPRSASASTPRSPALVPPQQDHAVATNSFALLKQLALHGAGMAVLPAHTCDAEVASGQLLSMPVDGGDAQAGLYLVYPSRRALTAKVKAFSDHLVAHLETGGTARKRSVRESTTSR